MKSLLKLSLFILLCTIVTSNIFAQLPTIASVSIDSVSCNGFSDGKIQVNITGGLPPYHYTISTGTGGVTTDTFYVFSGLPMGTYWIVVEDANGDGDIIFGVRVRQPDVLSVSFPVSNYCLNVPTPIDALVSGGNKIYSYFWDGTAVDNGFLNQDDIEDPTFTGKVAGNYNLRLTVIDNKGCTKATALSDIEVFNLPSVTFGGVLADQCANNTTYTLSGGNPVGGSYSGPGVLGTNFNASASGAPGTKIITYTYTDANSCTNNAYNNIEV